MAQRKYLDRAGEVDRLTLLATRIRKSAIENITKSKVGHPGGSLSVADILTALYFGRTYDASGDSWQPILRYNPADPLWPDRDRLVLSKGHAAPALYATLAEAGFFSKDLLKIYRKIDSPLEGHPVMYRVFDQDGEKREHGIRGVDFSTGSLGHGLSAAAGMALHAKTYGRDFQVFAVLGDGDLQEGMFWEACLAIPNKHLNNVCAIVDNNRLQVDGCVDDINSLDPLGDKFKAFNWDVRVISGHDFYDIIDALEYFKRTRSVNEKPLAIVANTIKGQGVVECEHRFQYHALPLTADQYEIAERDFNRKIEALEEKMADRKFPPLTVDALNQVTSEEIEQDLHTVIKSNPLKAYSAPLATRLGYGNALNRLGGYRKIFVLNADLSGACGNTAFCEKYPENAPLAENRRSMNVGVQEANMMTMGAGLASCGTIPVVNSFGVFAAGRAWEMVRQDISYPRLNVKIIGSHTGIALGEYGVSHQAISDVGLMRVLPHLTIIEPSDALQADVLFEKALLHDGPVYFRVGRNPSPIFYSNTNAYNIKPRIAFAIGEGYTVHEGSDITLICSGPILDEALKVATGVRQSVRVIDMPTIRPIDRMLIEKAAAETGWICTVQDHYENGGLKDEVLNVLSANRLGIKFNSIALSGFAESGSKVDLYEKYGLSAARIIEKLRLTPLKEK